MFQNVGRPPRPIYKHIDCSQATRHVRFAHVALSGKDIAVNRVGCPNPCNAPRASWIVKNIRVRSNFCQNELIYLKTSHEIWICNSKYLSAWDSWLQGWRKKQRKKPWTVTNQFFLLVSFEIIIKKNGENHVRWCFFLHKLSSWGKMWCSVAYLLVNNCSVFSKRQFKRTAASCYCVMLCTTRPIVAHYCIAAYSLIAAYCLLHQKKRGPRTIKAKKKK